MQKTEGRGGAHDWDRLGFWIDRRLGSIVEFNTRALAVTSRALGELGVLREVASKIWRKVVLSHLLPLFPPHIIDISIISFHSCGGHVPLPPLHNFTLLLSLQNIMEVVLLLHQCSVYYRCHSILFILLL